METALVTGGGGLIGAAVTRSLLEEGRYQPHVFDLRRSSLLADLDGHVEVTLGDLGEMTHVLDVVQRARPRVIYHLGGMLSMTAESDPAGALRSNVIGTFNILEAARRFDTPQVLFASTMATHGFDIEDQTINDDTLQRPVLFYGATKVLGEHMGLFHRRKHALDFRGLRYPAIVGPGVKNIGIAQYKSHVITASARGRAYTMRVKPETRHAFLYVKDAARAMIELGRAPSEAIKTVNYVLAGVQPTPSAAELADAVRERIPQANIDFAPDAVAQLALDRLDLPRDDQNAQREWGWRPRYDTAAMIDDFLRELEQHPQLYA